MKRFTLPAMAGLILAACATTEDVVITELDLSALPASVTAAIAAERPDFEVEEVMKKVRDGRTYYDVEGELGDGSELEFDVLMEGENARIVEIQRDLEWSDVPEDVRTVAPDASDGAEPVRTIESTQTDGAVIYEFFADGQPSDPAWEVRVRGGEVELLDERWMH
ncbi:MAG: hypothetical protein WA989_11385 [Henriciella sp.]|uniref:hypothetical protein n=1 Tax=Henriciella sp. TaxID=1968823 RepID=UPI003C791116